MEYMIAFGSNIITLQQNVNHYIKKGWEPQGGVSVTSEKYYKH